MTLKPNSTFGNYRIGDVIGEGGMGQVFLATDTTLDRKVAIKVLPESFAQDVDRVARFEREAKTLASLNHNNIAQIHGLENRDGVTAIVMELVEGPTLADRVAEGPLPPEEALRIARQIIDGLEAAHAKGIVHRDLKPANIKLTADGLIKILDFGIAKSVDSSHTGARHSPTIVTPAMTEAGVIMGTAAYMSPEQARGKFVDERTDIWAFGCVLYEMLTGQPVFMGEDVMVVMASILRDKSDLSSIPASISPAVRHAIKLCLEKDPKKRLHHIGDVRLALAGGLESDAPAQAEAQRRSPLQFWIRALPLAAVLAVLASAAVFWQMQPPAGDISRFTYNLPQGQVFRNTGRNVMALSPDGRHFVYNTAGGLYLRDMDTLEARLITGTEASLSAPVFAPDSQSVAYRDNTTEQLKRIAISGGAAVVIAEVADNFNDATWENDDRIYFGQPDGIYRVSANGGTPELVVVPQAGDGALFPGDLLPDGDTLLFTIGPAPGRIFAQSLQSGARTELLQVGNDPRYLPSGHLLYALDSGDLYAVRFDASSLTISGGPVPLLQNVMQALATAAVNYGVAGNGSLVYVHDNNPDNNQGPQNTLTWVDQNGVEEALDLPAQGYSHTRISPDGTRALVVIDGDIWVSDIDRPVLNRITATPDIAEFNPIWARDGEEIVFSDNASMSLFSILADGTGEARLLATIENEGNRGLVAPSDWVPGEDAILFTYGSGSNPRVGKLTLPANNDQLSNWQPFVDREAGASGSAIAPGGEWLAYYADDTGKWGVYIERFPGLGNRRLVSDSEGGWGPYWSADGSELYYRRLGDGAMMAVSIQAEPTLQIGTPRELFTATGMHPFNIPQANDQAPKSWGLAPDGRFLMIERPGDAQVADQENYFVIVQNWTEELQRLVPAE